MNTPARRLISTALVAMVAGESARAADTAMRVSTIDWARFQVPADPGPDYQQARLLLLNCARYNAGWLQEHFADEDGQNFAIEPPEAPRRHEHAFRAPCTIVYALALVLKTGIYDEPLVGIPREECMRRATRMIRALAAVHRANGDPHRGWGDHWQSALWSALLAHGAWLLWDELDEQTREMTIALVEHEADRFIAPDYEIPYWADEHDVRTPRDTKAEENAWNSMILHVAVAMLPDHPHADQWRQACSQLMVSAYARREDMLDEQTIVDGRPLSDWLDGYNVRDDGAVINHGRLHPDYATSITSITRAFLTQSLAAKPVPESADFNGQAVYRTLVEVQWSAPPYRAPGGAVYRPGRAEVYYPNGTDWSTLNFADYYLLDVNAHVLHWDRGLKRPAAEWMRLRAARLVTMQSRHDDRKIFAPGEFDTYPQPDAAAAWMIADAFLLLWLDAAGAIQPQANWLGSPTTPHSR